mmetsp:Transcript_18096/g.43270  ORF Transcript_18096/g.43270 Transcript_18096/m.43270 type:complete len:144 (-) Transcript_18096:28-459(-)
MWVAGQLRGAVAFAIALNTKSENRGTIATATITTVAVTMVMTAPMPLVLRWLGLKNEEHEQAQRGSVIQHSAQAPYELLEESVSAPSGVRAGLHARWRRIDEEILRPLFGGGEDTGRLVGVSIDMDFAPNTVGETIPEEDDHE